MLFEWGRFFHFILLKLSHRVFVARKSLSIHEYVIELSNECSTFVSQPRHRQLFFIYPFGMRDQVGKSLAQMKTIEFALLILVLIG